MARILPKRSLTPAAVPTTGDLDDGEFAINVPDGKVFVRDDTDIVIVAERNITLDYMDPTTTSAEELIDAMILAGMMAGPPPAVPTNTVAPAVTGGPSIGSTLTCSTGTWTGSPTSYAYQWEADTGTGYADLTGETANTLDTTGMADGDLLRCKVVATNGDGDSLPATSNAVTLSSGTLMTFGWDNGAPLADGSPPSEDRAWAAKYNKANSGTVTGIFCRFGNDSTTGNYKICAHAAGGTSPGALLWSTPSAVVPNGGGLVEFTLPGDVSGTDASGDYWLVAVSDGSGSPTLGGSTGSSIGVESCMANGTYSFSSPPSTWPGTDANYNVKYNIYCEYIG